jgi:hypothetical protein
VLLQRMMTMRQLRSARKVALARAAPWVPTAACQAAPSTTGAALMACRVVAGQGATGAAWTCLHSAAACPAGAERWAGLCVARPCCDRAAAVGGVDGSSSSSRERPWPCQSAQQRTWALMMSCRVVRMARGWGWADPA